MNSSVITLINGFLSKFLSVLMSVLLSLGVLSVEKRGDNDEPADPLKPYVFETEDEYFNYYDRSLYYNLSGTEPFDGSDIEEDGTGRFSELIQQMQQIKQVLVKEIKYEGFRVCLCENGTAAVTGVVLPMKTARFPAQVEGCPVVAIVNSEVSLNSYRANLHSCTSVIVPNTVEYISGPICFDTPFMQNIDLGERVRWVYSVAYACASLQHIRFPASLDTAGGLTLCYSVREIEFIDGVRAVDDIDACYAVKTVRLPETVEEIGDDAFRACTSLKDIYIPASVTEISEFAMDSGREDLTIHGVAGSYAERWAAEHGCGFVGDY